MRYTDLGDKWLLAPISFSVQSPRKVLVEDARVSKLIDQDAKWRKPHLTNTIFHEEAQIICQIPLCPVPSRNLLICRGMSNVVFSVRSAYHMEKEAQSMRAGGASGKEIGT